MLINRIARFAALMAMPLCSFATTVTSDATEDGGFAITENVYIYDDNQPCTSNQWAGQIFMLFHYMPDLTGATITSATFSIYLDSNTTASVTMDEIYVAVAGSWDETANLATMTGLSLGSDIGESITSGSSVWRNVDVTSAIQAIYAIDSTPAAVTISIASPDTPSDQVDELEMEQVGIGLTLGDNTCSEDGKQTFHERIDANYPRLSITYTSSSSVGRRGGSVGMIFGMNELLLNRQLVLKDTVAMFINCRKEIAFYDRT